MKDLESKLHCRNYVLAWIQHARRCNNEQGSVDRALGRSSFNRTYNAEEEIPGGQVEEIEKQELLSVKGLKLKNHTNT